jgi:GDP-D-mannose dehydratase
MYKVLICGSRDWDSFESILEQIMLLYQKYGDDFVVIEGEAKGADSIARTCAEKFDIEVEKYPANWDKYGRAAGPVRNKQMLVEGQPDLVLAFSKNLSTSKGTKNMVDQAREAGVEVRVYNE